MSFLSKLIGYMSTIIQFKDINIKEALLVSSDINPDGTREITYVEAGNSSITAAMIKAALNPNDNNTSIVSFEEFKHFTGLTGLADNLFKGCTNLKEIRFPLAVQGNDVGNILHNTSIESLHLEGITSLTVRNNVNKWGTMSALKEVWIPDLQSLDGSIFSKSGQPNIEKIIISSVEQWLKINTRINALPSVSGKASLYLMTDLEHPVTSITTLSEAIPGVTTVPTVFPYNFSNLKSITNITIGGQNTDVKDGAFSYLPNTVTISNFSYVTKVAANSFRECKASGIEIFPSGIDMVDDYTFYGSSITKVESDNLLDLRSMYSFANTPITSVKIDNCTNLRATDAYQPQGSFSGCTQLTTISANAMSYIPRKILEGCNNLLTASFASATRVKYNAFFQCSKLTTLNAPNVINIEHDAFYECFALEDSGFNFNLGNVVSIGQLAFKGCINITCPCIFYNLNFIGENAFGGAKSPTEKYVVFKYQGIVQYELGQQQLYSLGTFGTVGGSITAIYVPDGNLTIDGVTKTYLQWYQEDAVWSEFVSRNSLTLDVESNIPT